MMAHTSGFKADAPTVSGCPHHRFRIEKMSLDTIPIELFYKILEQLEIEPNAHANLASTCKRLREQVRSYPRLGRATCNFCFDESSIISRSRSLECKQCVQPTSKSWRCKDLYERIISTIGNISKLFNNQNSRTRPMMCQCQDTCYYRRFTCLMTLKNQTFDTLKFDRAHLYRVHCISAIDDSLSTNKTLAKLQIESLTTLKFCGCRITVEWMDALMCRLPNIQCLEIKHCEADQRSESESYDRRPSPSCGGKTLNKLTIQGRIHEHFSKYLFDNYPAEELDIYGILIISREPELENEQLHDNPVGLDPLLEDYLLENRNIVKQVYAGPAFEDPRCWRLDSFLRIIDMRPELRHIRVHTTDRAWFF